MFIDGVFAIQVRRQLEMFVMDYVSYFCSRFFVLANDGVWDSDVLTD